LFTQLVIPNPLDGLCNFLGRNLLRVFEVFASTSSFLVVISELPEFDFLFEISDSVVVRLQQSSRLGL
jgi:hypothetical protein